MSSRDEGIANILKRVSSQEADVSVLRQKMAKMEGSLKAKDFENERLMRELAVEKEKARYRAVTKNNRLNAEHEVTHGGKFKQWSKTLITITRDEFVMDSRRKTLESHLRSFQEGKVPANMMKELKPFLITVPPPFYPEVQSEKDKDQWNDRRVDILMVAAGDFMKNLEMKRSANEKSSGEVFLAVQEAFGTAVALKFKDVCVRMGAERHHDSSKPDYFETLSFNSFDLE